MFSLIVWLVVQNFYGIILASEILIGIIIVSNLFVHFGIWYVKKGKGSAYINYIKNKDKLQKSLSIKFYFDAIMFISLLYIIMFPLINTLGYFCYSLIILSIILTKVFNFLNNKKFEDKDFDEMKENLIETIKKSNAKNNINTLSKD